MASEIRVECGAGDAEFTPTEVAEIAALLRAARHRFDTEWADRAPARLVEVLVEAVQALPVPEGCTGCWDEYALIVHDGDTCPVHELDPSR